MANESFGQFNGLLLRALSGFYYVEAAGKIWTCSLRGKFRKQKIQFLPGDSVIVTDLGYPHGVIEGQSDRTNRLVRPAVANVTTALIVFALSNPQPDLLLLDRLLIQVLNQKIRPVLCFNKGDTVSVFETEEIIAPYRNAGFKYQVVSAKTGIGIDELREGLGGGIIILAGPSGVGKSSIINALQPDFGLETNTLSKKVERGRHTTRRVELLKIGHNSYIADTPGFSVLDLPADIEPYQLSGFYPEFDIKEPCYFQPCFHYKESGCAVCDLIEKGTIDKGRYQRYLRFLDELNQRKENY